MDISTFRFVLRFRIKSLIKKSVRGLFFFILSKPFLKLLVVRLATSLKLTNQIKQFALIALQSSNPIEPVNLLENSGKDNAAIYMDKRANRIFNDLKNSILEHRL